MRRPSPAPASPRTLLVWILLAAGTAAPLAAVAQPTRTLLAADRVATEAEVPVRRITLYHSGVGYFERSGTIDGDRQLQLRFKTEQINDILKSMVLLDLDGGRIDSVSYASKEPLNKRLASFGINIADNPSAGQILERLRGTSVRLTSHEGDATGTIMNVEQRKTVFHSGGSGGTGAAVFDLPWINLLTDKGVRSFDLTKVSGFEILDKELAEELTKALSTIAEYRADTSKTVDLRFAGTGTRRVVVGYVQESPVWKTSYRLILPEKDAPAQPGDGNKGSVVVQGWAIVENTTDQDWDGVRLALVSGRPVSFQMDLYEPLFTFRPMVPVPTIPGVMPRAYSAGVDAERAEAPGRRMATLQLQSRLSAGASPAPASAAKGAAESDFNYDRATSAAEMVDYAAQAQAQAGEVGEVFQFQIENPVTIERQRSAMIPIISSNITGRRVSIFAQGDGRPNPMRGVEIVNEANLQLLPGPISVFDGAAYAGDAQIGHVGKGDKRLLAYSVDLDVNVLTSDQSHSTVTRVRIVDGSFIRTVSTTNTVEYVFDNKDAQRGRTIIIEQPRLRGWNLVEPKIAKEETQDLYRFELPVEAAKTAAMTVSQERTESETVGIVSIDMPTLLFYHKNGKLSPAVLKAVEEISRRQSEINTAERQVAELDRQRSEIDAEQARIRENMGRIDRASQLYTRYMTTLTEQENTLETLRDSRKAATANLESLRAAFNQHLRSLNVE